MEVNASLWGLMGDMTSESVREFCSFLQQKLIPLTLHGQAAAFLGTREK